MNRLGIASNRHNFQPLCATCNGAKADKSIDYRPNKQHVKLLAYLESKGVSVQIERRGAAEPRRHRYNAYCNVA